MLFQADLSGSSSSEIFVAFWSGQEVDDAVREFSQRLVTGVLDRVAALDAIVAESADNWRIERMAVVDRNVLRLGVFEILYEPSTPPAVVIDEAIEIAKKFGNHESGAFINGILDDVRLRHQSGKIQVPS
jgi:N utilization substance protein B